MKYYIHPSIARGEFDKSHGGIRGSLEAHSRLLPYFGWNEVDDELRADLVVGYLSTESTRLDVFHLRGLYPTGELELPRGFWRANSSIIENLRRARHVVCVSEWVANMLRREMHMSPSVVPGHGLDLAKWDGVQPWDGVDEPYALWNKTRIHGVCDPTPLLKLAHQFPNYQFVSTFLPKGAQVPPNVIVTGLLPYEEAWKIVRSASIYLATTKETFGRGTLEAMASGCNVVGFAWGATPDVLGECGTLVEPYDYDALSVAFEAVIHEGKNTEGRERVDTRFKWESIVAQTATVYDRIYSQPSPKPKVSFVVPCHDYGRYVGDTIKSISKQTFTNWELVVVDNASTDDSVEVIQNLIAGDSRMRLIHEPAPGVAHARNAGIDVSTGEFVSCVDADDAVAPAFLQTLVPHLDADCSLGIVYSGIELMNEKGFLRGHSHLWPHQYDLTKGLEGNQIPTCCLFRRSWWERLGGYNPRFAPRGAGQEDSDFWFRILANGGGARKVTDEGLFYYRVHPEQATRVHRGDWEKNVYPGWYPFVSDGLHPIASQLAVPPQSSFAVRDYDYPLVSIVVPVGPGHAHFLTDSLDSVEAQSFRNWELIVVNDSGGDIDLTPWPYVKIVTTEGGRGAGYARNVGTRLARGKFVTYLDVDDFLQSHFLEFTLEAYERAGGWVYTDTYIYRGDGSLDGYDVPDWDPTELWHHGIAPVTCLYTKDMWEEVGGFDEVLTREDWDFHLRLAKAGYCGTKVDSKPLLTYRHSTGNRRSEGSRRKEILVLHERYDEEELTMACRGCGRGGGRKVKVDRVSITPTNWQTKDEAGFVRLEFVGKNKNDLTFKGPSGRKYLAGNNEYHRIVLVHPSDVDRLLLHTCFDKPKSLPRDTLVAEPNPVARKVRSKPKPEVEPPVTVETPDIVGISVDFDIATLSLAGLKRVDLSRHKSSDIGKLIETEELGKNRSSVVAHLGRARRKVERIAARGV